MGWLTWLGLAFLVSLAVYSPKIPFTSSSSISQSIKDNIPDDINTFFENTYSFDETSSNPSLSMKKLGKVDCTSESICSTSFPGYSSYQCIKGECYGSQ